MPYDSETRMIDAELAERQLRAGKIDPDVRQWILRDLEEMMPRLEAKSAQCKAEMDQIFKALNLV